jgi:hypothetical protein
MRKPAIWAAGVAAAAVVVVAVASTGTATAATALPDKTVLTSSSQTDYTFSTTTTAWSVVALQSSSAANYDLRMFTSGGTALDKSLLGTGKTDFVAINSHSGKRALGGYKANVKLTSGSGNYAIQLRKTPKILTLPTPAWDGVSDPSDPDITFVSLNDSDVVSLYEIHLDAGQKFWVSSNAVGRLYLLESIPDATTWIKTRAEDGNANATLIDNCTLYSSAMTNWHALVLVADRMPTSGTGGIGFALHKYDPARPNTCPIRNFPGPTPA